MLEAFQGNANCTKDQHNVASQVGTPRNVSGENMTRHGEVEKCPKNGQKVIIHAFGLARGPSSELHGMPPRAMRGHWKVVMWLETNIWIRFHEK